MIPASYMFKNTYRQHWEEPDAPVVVELNTRFYDGLTTPIGAAIAGLLTWRPHHGHHTGKHAYD